MGKAKQQRATKQEFASFPPQTTPAAEPETRAIVLTSTVALGNGTRNTGTVLGTMGADGQIIRVEGISEVEIQTALRNPQIISLK